MNCQNDEVSPDVHTCNHPDVTRSGRQIPPQSTTASCLLSTAPHLAQRGILNEPVYSLKLGIFRVPWVYRDEACGRSILVNSRVLNSVKQVLNLVKQS